MADVITRFKLETSQFDSKLRDTAKALQGIAHQASLGGKDFNDFNQKAIESARALGTVQSGANNTKDKLRDLVGSYNDAAKAYNSLTETAKKGEFGQAMSQSLTQLQQRIRETKEELYSMGGSGVMQNLKGVMDGVAGKFGMSASMFTGVGASVAAAAGAFKLVGDNINLAMNFEKSMSQLSSLTGMVGKDLDQLKEYAIELGSTSTLTASQVADAFRLIGSQQPQLLESGQALKEVTKYAITLSEAAGIDLQTAAQTLSTSINQMGGDSNNAARYVNVLAAASQKGAGDIAWLGEAITKSATAAKAVGTDYEELVANLEQLAKAGFDASTAGTALRSIIMNLEKQANNDFKPSVVGLTQAFENLGKANLDIVGYQQIAGKMFASQAMALANAAQEAKNMTTAITGTNVATEQATTNTANLDGSLKSLSSAWEALNLHINSSNGLLKDCVDWLKNVVQWADQAFTAAGRAQRRLQEMQGGGNGEPTKVDKQINALRGSNYKVYARQQTLNAYDKQIADLQAKIDNGGKLPGAPSGTSQSMRWLEAQKKAIETMRNEYATRSKQIAFPSATTDTKGGKAVVDLSVDVDGDGSGMKTIKQLQDELKELKKLRDEAINKKDFKARDTYNAQIKQVNAEIKSLRGGTTTTTTTHQTPQQRAQESFTKAEQNYKQALEQAAMELEAGTITRAEAKKKEMQAAEARWKAIGDARNISDSPELKQAQNEAAANYKALAAEVKTATERQKAIDKATRDLENANQKLAAARSEMAQAKQQGDLQAYNTAKDKATAAQQEITRLEKVKVNVETGTVNLPNIPTEMTTTVDFEANTRNIDAAISYVKKEMDTIPVGTIDFNLDQTKLADLTTLKTLITEQVKNGLQIDPNFAQSMFSNILAGKDIENTTWQAQVDNINKNRTDNGLDPLKIDYKTGEKENGKETKKLTEQISTLTSGLSSIAGGLKSMGINLPAEVDQVIGVIQGVTSVIEGVNAIISIFSTSTMSANTIALSANTAALLAVAATNFFPFANGGVVHAAGGTVAGNTYSGDQIPAMLNAGEVVLNRAQTGNLASQLQGGVGAMQLSAIITGEQLRLVLNNNGRRTGRGEYVTTNFR